MQVVLVKELYKKNDQLAGDVVGFFEDDHIFSAHEMGVFNIITIDSTIVTAFEESINQHRLPNMELIVHRQYYEDGILKWN